MPTITCVLVANRGEIARRVFRTCARAGHRAPSPSTPTPTRDAPFVAEADDAVALRRQHRGGVLPRRRADPRRRRARAGADAVHPGYGFLSENADFAAAVGDAGLVWVGPPPEAMRRDGLKIEAKELHGGGGRAGRARRRRRLRRRGRVAAAAEQVGFPLLVKASAGGGGKGMRVVRDAPAELAEAVARRAPRGASRPSATARSSSSATSSGARHVEVQVFGDAHGNVVHLCERECSIQRRHQKIVEESPSPGRRRRAARARCTPRPSSLARGDRLRRRGHRRVPRRRRGRRQEFFFLEMNTRLQVEHPVTEAVTGLDLVRWQLEVARGRAAAVGAARDRRAAATRSRCALYAEDPASGYLPSIGRCDAFAMLRRRRCASTAGRRGLRGLAVLRPDAGQGDRRTRRPAPRPPRCWRAACAPWTPAGWSPTATALVAILDSAAFGAGETDTDFLDVHPGLLQAGPDDEVTRAHLLAATLRGVGAAPRLRRGAGVRPERLAQRAGPAAARRVRRPGGRRRGRRTR